MPPALHALNIPMLEVGAQSVGRALQAARIPAQAVAAAHPELRAVLQAARAAARELGAAPCPELARHACLVRFDAQAWPTQDFHRCVLNCVAANWVGAGQPMGWQEQGPGVFRVLESVGAASAARGDAPAGSAFQTLDAAMRPSFQPEMLSYCVCANRARAGAGLLDVGELYEALPPALREVAMQQRFCHAADAALGPTCSGLSEPRSLFWKSPQGMMGALDLALTRPARAGDAAALRVLCEIGELARAHATWIELRPGEVLLLRNHALLHAWRAAQGHWRVLRTAWRQSLLALGNFAGTGQPGMFSAQRALRACSAR